jgi:glucose/arabinose dehydrogenase
MSPRIGGVALVLSLLLAAGCTADEGTGPVVNNPEETSAPPTDETTPPESAGPTETATPTQTQTKTPQGKPVVVETIATGLTSPWGLAFLPDGDALVSERDTGLIKRVASDGSRVAVVGEIAEADPSSEGGLLGLAVHPRFPDQPWVYAYYSTETDNRVVRMRYEDGRLGPQRVLLTGIQVAEIHNGGRLAFGPDGLLYVTTGDGSETQRAQDRTSLNGKILRLTPAGRPAKGNPFGDNNQIFSLGHRNVQGITWDDSGNLYASEFGQDTWDELNHVRPGANFGWPAVEGKVGTDTGYVDPIVQWSPEEASPSGIVWAAGAVWMTGLRGERLWKVQVTDEGSVRGEPEAFFTGEYGRLRTIELAPDGTLWLMTSNTDGRASPREGDDRILRLRLR